MHSFRRRRLARSIVTLIAVMGVMLAALGWYTPQPARAQTASLLINNHLCPNPISSIDMIDLAPNCPGVGSNWSFTVTHTGGLYQQTLQTDASGMASFGSMPAGVYRIDGATTPDFSKVAVYCNVKDGLGNDVTGWLYGYADNYYTELNIAQDGYMGYCDWWWYNPGATPQPTTGSVMINKIDCPPGYDVTNVSIYDLAATCHGQGQYEFSLTDANAGNQSGTTPGSGLNTVSFSNVPSGPMLITEDAPGDYLQPRVFCKNQKLTGEEDSEDEVPVNNFAINPTLKQGYDNLYCDWFNVPSPDKVNITITKYECPDGFVSSDPSQLTSTCTEPYNPVTFKLDGASSGNPGDQDTGSVIPNGVQWTNMDADTWYITEFLPQGHNQPIIFCSVTDHANNSQTGPQQQSPEQVQDGYRLTYTLDGGTALSCDWFNTKGTPTTTTGTISIHKYGCPEGYDTSWDLQQWSQFCTTIVQGASFTVSSGSTSDEQQLTGIDLTWEQLAPGDYTVTETQPSAWSGSVVYCASGTGDTLGSYESADVTDNGISDTLESGELLDCYWYNLAKPRPVATIDPNAPATLTIVKFTCKEDYDPLAQDAKPAKDCDEKTDDITFSIIGAKNASISGKTGDDGEGTVTFKNLKPGSYLLQETYPEHTQKAFIWSCESSTRVHDYPFAPFARIDETGMIKVSLTPGETLKCDWYNVPSPPEEEATPSAAGGDVAVTIDVFMCPTHAVSPASCDPVEAGVGISLTSTSGNGEPIDLETDDTGVATGSVPADEYDVDADEMICFAESPAFTSTNTLDLTSEDSADVQIYFCGQH